MTGSTAGLEMWEGRIERKGGKGGREGRDVGIIQYDVLSYVCMIGTICIIDN